MIVVSDTSALCYLLLIDAADLLPKLFGRVVIPGAVHSELTAEGSPEAIRHWASNPPA